MKRIVLQENIENFCPTTNPYAYICHYNENKLFYCNCLPTCGGCINKLFPIKRWIAKGVNERKEIYVDFGWATFNKIQIRHKEMPFNTESFHESFTSQMEKMIKTCAEIKTEHTIPNGIAPYWDPKIDNGNGGYVLPYDHIDWKIQIAIKKERCKFC